jgi:serine/threonine-protein kinase
MSEHEGSPSELPDGDRPTGTADGPSASSVPSGSSAPTTDGTGPIERSSGGRMFAGRYQLLARRGTATDVALFEAVDTVTQRSVAVKIVHPDICAADGFAERFADVMGEVARTLHPNLTEIIDIGTSTWGGRPVHFVVCENLTGGSLRDLRDRGRQLSPSQVVMIGLDACRGLDVAHRAGFVHGDIRPANLVFGADGRLRLADVGLAALVSDAWWVEPTGVDIEQAKFASPEQAQGLEPTTKSDVYALCLCLLEAVTGHLPFVGDSSVATLSNRVDKLLPVSADLGPLAAVLERAGRPDQDDRSSASEFGRALHQAAEKLPRPAPLALVAGGLFAAAPGDPTSPSGMIRRPAEPTAVEPDVPDVPVIPVIPVGADAAAGSDAPDVPDAGAPVPAGANAASSKQAPDGNVEPAPSDEPGVDPSTSRSAALHPDVPVKPWLPDPRDADHRRRWGGRRRRAGAGRVQHSRARHDGGAGRA